MTIAQDSINEHKYLLQLINVSAENLIHLNSELPI